MLALQRLAGNAAVSRVARGVVVQRGCGGSCGCGGTCGGGGEQREGEELQVQRAAVADGRCHEGETCPDEPLVDHQGAGTTSCDMDAGTMSSTQTEHCAGDCVAQHEGVHRGDRATCCSRVGRCIANAADAAGQTRCRDAYTRWHPRLSDWTECRAYRHEVGCLNTFIGANCRRGRETIAAACCRTLERERRFARGETISRCPGTRAACPFRADGTLP